MLYIEFLKKIKIYLIDAIAVLVWCYAVFYAVNYTTAMII